MPSHHTSDSPLDSQDRPDTNTWSVWYQRLLNAILSVPSGSRRRLTASADLDLKEKWPLHYVLFCTSLSSPAILFLFCKNVSSAKQRQFSELRCSLIFEGSVWFFFVICMKDSFPDCMFCQMEDSCREMASNASQGMKQRLDCENQGYWLWDCGTTIYQYMGKNCVQ